MDRCSGLGPAASAVVADFMLSVLSIDPRNSLDSVEIVEAGEKVDSKER